MVRQPRVMFFMSQFETCLRFPFLSANQPLVDVQFSISNLDGKAHFNLPMVILHTSSVEGA